MKSSSSETKKKTNAMPETRQVGSISRTLLLPSEHPGTIRLRYQLAEDGCKESQVALAKCLLTSPIKNLEDRNFNAQLAVYWLLRAANKGQEEAITLLKDCANTGVGINTRNSFEVEKCLKFSEKEILSRRVAYSIFRATMSDTEDILSEASFREKVEKLLQEDSDEQFMSNIDEEYSVSEKLLPSKQSNENKISENVISQSHISFSEVVNSVQTCLESSVPLVSLKQVTEYGGSKRWLNVKYLSVVWNLLIRGTEDFIDSFASMTALISVLLVCICLSFAYSLTAPGTEINKFIYNCNLFMVTLSCLLALLSTTCFVISISFGIENMQKWLNLIKIFEPNIKTKEVEKKYLLKTASPLLTFFIITAIYMILIPLSSAHHIFLEVGILALFLMFFVDRSISHQRYYVNISLILNVLTCLYKSDILQKWSVNSFSFLNFDIMYELGRNYKIHLSFISCLALPFVLPYLYLKMALGNEQKGWHLVLLPHLMSVSWMNLALFHLAEIESTNLIFSLFMCLFILILSRYFGIIITFMLYVIVKAIIISEAYYLILLIPVFSTFYIISTLCVRKFKLSNENRLCSLFVCILILILSLQAVQLQTFSTDSGTDSVLLWDKYQTHCHHRSWYRTNPAEVQIACLPFKGRKISIDGSVTSIEVTQIKNNVQTIANMLPSPLYDWFTCAFGKRYMSCNDENISPSEKVHCQLYETLNISHCHIHNWDEYNYEITMEVSSRTSPEVVMLVDHICSPFVRNLKEGDFLKVVGIFESNMGGLLPKLSLIKAECTTCYSSFTCNTSVLMPQPNFSYSLKNIVWFYLSPFIQYVE